MVCLASLSVGIKRYRGRIWPQHRPRRVPGFLPPHGPHGGAQSDSERPKVEQPSRVTITPETPGRPQVQHRSRPHHQPRPVEDNETIALLEILMTCPQRRGPHQQRQARALNRSTTWTTAPPYLSSTDPTSTYAAYANLRCMVTTITPRCFPLCHHSVPRLASPSASATSRTTRATSSTACRRLRVARRHRSPRRLRAHTSIALPDAPRLSSFPDRGCTYLSPKARTTASARLPWRGALT